MLLVRFRAHVWGVGITSPLLATGNNRGILYRTKSIHIVYQTAARTAGGVPCPQRDSGVGCDVCAYHARLDHVHRRKLPLLWYELAALSVAVERAAIIRVRLEIIRNARIKT